MPGGIFTMYIRLLITPIHQITGLYQIHRLDSIVYPIGFSHKSLGCWYKFGEPSVSPIRHVEQTRKKASGLSRLGIKPWAFLLQMLSTVTSDNLGGSS